MTSDVERQHVQDATNDPDGSAAGFEPVYAIFEGGGAKGISHVGALKAMEENDLALVGVAGTSAGAIMAALTAVGYAADEIFPAGGAGNILSGIGLEPLDFVGRARWRAYRVMRRALLPLLAIDGVAIVASLALATALISRGWTLARVALGPTIAIAIGSTCVTAALVLPAVRRRGLFETTQLREAVNELLRRKVEAHRASLGIDGPAPARVRFRDIDPLVLPLCCRLKIVVSDVRGGKLVVFDHTTPDVVIAEAVAASAAIPIAFTPPGIPSAQGDGDPVYADGGLVSNLPTWAFRQEKAALQRQRGGPPIPIIACTLVEPVAEQVGQPLRMSVLAYLQSVFRTAIAGSQEVAHSLVDDLERIEIPSPLSTLAFDCSSTEALAAYEAGCKAARASLSRRRGTKSLTSRILRDTLAAIATVVHSHRSAAGLPLPRLRLSLIDPVRKVGGPSMRSAWPRRLTWRTTRTTGSSSMR